MMSYADARLDPNDRPSWASSTADFFLARSPLGWMRKCSALTDLEIILFVATCGTVFMTFWFSGLLIKRGDSHDKAVFAVVAFVNGLWILFYLFHGVLIESLFELISMCVTLLILYALFIANYIVESEPELYSISLAVVVCSTVFTLLPSVGIGVVVTWTYYSSRNLMFRIIGNDRRKQRMCMMLLSAQSLLIFDTQWTLICFILVFQHGFTFINLGLDEMLSVAVGPALLASWFIMGYCAIRFESRWLTWIFAVSSLIFQPMYILYLCVHSWIEINFKLNLLNITLYIAGASCLVSHLSLIAILVCVSFNYGRGLSQEVYVGRTDESQLFEYNLALQRYNLDKNSGGESLELPPHPLPKFVSKAKANTRTRLLLTTASGAGSGYPSYTTFSGDGAKPYCESNVEVSSI